MVVVGDEADAAGVELTHEVADEIAAGAIYQYVFALAHGFGVLQFNAVVESNVHARHLYERLGFTQLGTIPHGFRMKDGSFANICPYYKEIVRGLPLTDVP